MNVLVTGGAGYIGSHVVLELLEAGHEVVVVDDLSTGHRQLVDDRATLVVADVGDRSAVSGVLERHGVEAVLHFAGSIVVSESVDHPLKYYSNNTSNTRRLVECCIEADIEEFVFSSTAAVYGDPETIPVAESAPTEPVNPYGRSKLMVEWMLEDAARAHDFSYVALRYFNVAGADPAGRTGQTGRDATHLVKVATQAALGIRSELAIFGTDYPTPDGTCIRDFIHVSDLASVHLRALDYLEDGGGNCALNCGYGRGFSVREVVETVRRVSGVEFPVRETDRRPGDPSRLVAATDRLHERLDWSPEYDDLETIIETALEFERKWTAEPRPEPAG